MKSLLVLGPISGKKDEAVEHHAGAEDGNVLQSFLENDKNVTVHAPGVGDPPEVEPVGVYLGRLSNMSVAYQLTRASIS